MAHTKAGGSTRQQGNRHGKRLGVKSFGDEKVKVGDIIVRQKGSKFHPGDGAKMGVDFTIYAIKVGLVKFSTYYGRQIVSVV